MTNTFFFKKEDSNKILIIAILAEEGYLTASQVSERINTVQKVSYQAIHKALNQLHEQGILEKQDNEFDLNLDWLKKISEFSEKMVKKKQKQKKKTISINQNMLKEINQVFNPNEKK